jgi:hypothetical protein
MNPSHVPSTAPSEDQAVGVDAEFRRPEEGPERPAAAPPETQPGPRHSGWTVGRISSLAIGSVIVLFALLLLGAGGTGLWADRTQRDAGYVTSDVHDFSTPGSALATESTELGSAGVGSLYPPALLGDVRIRVTRTSSGPPLFVGIGRSADVNRYLAGVDHAVISEFWGDQTETVEGGPVGSPPGAQDFWVTSATGPGTQTVEWDPADGSWTVVVMNADGQRGIDVGADLGARLPAVLWVSVGVLLAGAVFLAGGALLIAGGIRDRRAAAGRTA